MPKAPMTEAKAIPTRLMRALPNWLTASRVVMALVFFAVLTLWRYEGSAASMGRIDLLLILAAALFGVAVLTDALDGYLARRWQTESAFGRIMDPFADKVLVVGAFVFLAGPDFWWSAPAAGASPTHALQLTGLYPWMVVVILGRELLVTSIRSVLESQGIQFASDWWGKGKMILQSAMIPAVLVLIALFPVEPRTLADGTLSMPWARWAIDLLVWLTIAVTLISGLPYIRRCSVLLAARQRGKPQA